MAYEGGASDEHVQKLKMRYDSLKSSPERKNVEAHCQEVAELVSPRKVQFVGVVTPGEKKMTKVFDSTGIHANELLAAGLHGMATNPASKWFSLRMVSKKVPDANGEMIEINELPEVQQYLSDVEHIMWQRIYQPGSNFTPSLHEIYLDLGAFATAILFVGQRDNGGLLFQDRPLAECVIDESYEGRVDTVYRKTEYTVRQMWQMRATKENPDGWTISDKVSDLARAEKWDEKICVIHAVYPREERDPTKAGANDMPWASCYFEHDACHQLEMSGFPEFPYLVARWSKYAGEIYGRSPAMTALPDIKMLQAMELAKIKVIQKAADPVTWLRDDGVVGPVRQIPGGINYFRGNPGEGVMLQPTSMQGIQALMADQENLRQRILRTFFADIMRMVDRPDMTATEVVQRTAEQMRLFGPLIGRLEGELLGPLIERVYGILSRLGLLPEAPEIIEDMEFSVEYVSPIATAQKQTAVNGVMQAMQVAMLLGEEAAPQVIAKNVDVDKLFRWAWNVFNNDPDLLADEEKKAENDQTEKMNQMTQMMGPIMDMIQKGAGAANQGAGAVKQLGEAQAAPGGIDVGQLAGGVADRVGQSPAAQEMSDGYEAAFGQAA